MTEKPNTEKADLCCLVKIGSWIGIVAFGDGARITVRAWMKVRIGMEADQLGLVTL